MKLSFITLTASLLFLLACTRGSSLPEQLQALETAFASLSDPDTGLLNQTAANTYLEEVAVLLKDHPTDTAIALPLYRAAEVARAMGQAPLAISYYEQIAKNFLDFNRVGEANFMLAFTYDEDLKDLEKAKTAYEYFIEHFPNHDFADDAQMLLKNLGKTDEEILRELEALIEAQAAENSEDN